jgi:hypothetical protein
MAVLLNQITVGELKILVLDSDPSQGAGYADAEIGSIAIIQGQGGIYQKTGAGDTAWATSSVNAEDVQDIVAAFVQDSATIEFTYDDPSGTLEAAIKALSIDNGLIAANAAIDASKIADGSVSNAEFQRLDGVASNIQDQFNDLGQDLQDHINDAVGAHAASAISVAPAGDLASTDVQAALEELQADVNSRIPSSEKGAANGVASLDSNGKVPLAQLPNSIVEYKGTWDASTNTPTLANGAGNPDTAIGDVYRAAVAGTVDFGAGNITFAIGDYAILNDSKIWEKAQTSEVVSGVSSVNGLVGDVILTTTEIGEGTNLYFTENRARTAAVADQIQDGVTNIAPSQNAVFDALALKIDSSEKGQANGVATLDPNGLIPANQLPSFVDDVLEFADLASFPVTGESGKIYVALDTGKVYRWSGSIYIEISASEVNSVNGQTGAVVLDSDDINEGTTNLYFTVTRARDAAVADQIIDGVVDVAPSQNAVFDALALKVNKAGDTMTGDLNMSNNDLLAVDRLGLGSATPDTKFHLEENNVKLNLSAFSTETSGAVNAIIASVTPENNSVQLMKAYVTGFETATNLSVAYERTVRIKNNAGTVSLGSIQSDYTDEDNALNQANCTFVVNANAVDVRVTGVGSRTLTWKCVLKRIR